MKIYGVKISGNCYKVQLVCHMLGLDYQWIDVDIMAGATQTSYFLAKNPNGKVPLLELDDGRCLSESNAIINYLAAGSELLPSDPFALALVQQWQFFEQYSHEPYIAVARFIQKFQGLPEARLDEYNSKKEGGNKALKIMDEQLKPNAFITGSQVTVADIALFAYTHVAEEGGFDLTHYAHVRRWLDDMKALPGFVAMGS